jgi:hypothetical protein
VISTIVGNRQPSVKQISASAFVCRGGGCRDVQQSGQAGRSGRFDRQTATLPTWVLENAGTTPTPPPP